MSDSPASPLLGAETSQEPSRPRSKSSKHSFRSGFSRESREIGETTPLLPTNDHDARSLRPPNRSNDSNAETALRWVQGGGELSNPKKPRRWPSFVALTILCLVAIVIMCLGFAAPEVVQEYSKEAVVFEPTGLSIDSFTASGVKARVQGTFSFDASRVHKKPVRELGRAGTWIAREVESKESELEIYLPEYGNLVLGKATIPPIKVNVRNGHKNHLDFVAHLQPGDADSIRHIIHDWIHGRLAQLHIKGTAIVPLRSGATANKLAVTGKDIPAMPQYNITKVLFHEVGLPNGPKGMAADVSVDISNHYPVKLFIPPLAFAILVPNCSPSEPYLLLADATTDEIHVEPKKDIGVEVGGFVRKLPDTLTTTCPNSNSSPLDSLLANYIKGDDTTIYVRGSNKPSADTPDWIVDLMSSMTVPITMRGHTFEGLIKKFSLDNVHFSLPDPFAEPDTPESNPRVSAIIKAVVGLPKEMNFAVNVTKVRADADVFYEGKKLGYLNLHKWQKANSTRIDGPENQPPELEVESQVKDAPLEITDQDVFTDVIQQILFKGRNVTLDIKAAVDVKTDTALGTFVVREIPAEGKVPVHPMTGGGKGGHKGSDLFKFLNPHVNSLEILETTRTSILLQAQLNLSNPTPYTATVPYASINFLNNNTILGHATVKNLDLKQGNNTDVTVQILWDPRKLSGDKGVQVGRDFISQYISGWNTSLTLRTSNATLPSLPVLGDALSLFPIELPTPRLKSPKSPNDDDDPDGDDPDSDDSPHFIESATMHLFSSTAQFVILSPLRHTSILLTHINATALYKSPETNVTHPVGRILYEYPLNVPPGRSETPKLPVEWSLGGVGYDAVKRALGGDLKLDARAEVGVRIGRWETEGGVWFVGRGLGVRVRL
ncbi:MAG: hypothetical protein M1834_004560 [Cirrosporium novae-zelandiae]|nr:MAG: hypothetical protein M1834_004560 [Cirrosporium novae-zelandiae]